jgi:hypothetical protein
MAITNGYCTLAEVKAALRLANSDTTEDALLENSIEAASRRIDGYCNTFFYQKQATIKLFTRFPYVCSIPDLALSAITLKTDDNGDGTFETTWTASDYYLDPVDTALTGLPFRKIVASGSRSFPLLYDPNRPAIELTGTFGYPAIPEDVREACVLLAMRGFARYNSALGIVGFADMAITVRAVDPDVRDYLMPYRQLIGI